MHYKKQLKRLYQVRKQVGQQRDLLRAMRLEGFTAVTFHTTTRQLTLHNEHGAANEAADNYDEGLSIRRQELKAQASEVRQLWVEDERKEAKQQSATFNNRS